MPPPDAAPGVLDDAFIRDAEATIRALREAFGAVVAAACGPIEAAQDVAIGFGIHRKLGWQIARVAFDDAPLLAARYMPSPRGVTTWLDAARARNVSDELCANAADAAARFEALVTDHAGDRPTLEMLLESCADTRDVAVDEQWRREAFRGNAYVWGIRTRAMLGTVFLHPSAAHDGYFDMARLHGFIGLVRTRPERRWVIAQSVAFDGDGDEIALQRAPLDPETAERAGGVPLVARFCSSPTPDVVRRPGDAGLVNDELLPGPVGQSGERTVICGEIIRALAPAYAIGDDRTAVMGTGVRTPCETLICDMFVHDDLFPGVERELVVFSELISPVSRDAHDELRVPERVQSLGRGVHAAQTACIPNYTAMARDVCAQLGWDPDAFQLHRIRMKYPPIPTSVMFRHPMPDPPPGWSPTR